MTQKAGRADTHQLALHLLWARQTWRPITRDDEPSVHDSPLKLDRNNFEQQPVDGLKAVPDSAFLGLTGSGNDCFLPRMAHCGIERGETRCLMNDSNMTHLVSRKIHRA